jgi:hypothetical protein
MFLSNTTLFDGRCVFTLLPTVQLHVSALDNSHLQVVHESLESSYTRYNMGCVQCGVGGGVGTRSGTCHGGWGGTWDNCYCVLCN